MAQNSRKRKATTNSRAPRRAASTMPSNGSSTAQTIYLPPATFTSIQRSGGPFRPVKLVKDDGSTCIPVSEIGTDELKRKLLTLALSEINSAIESYILTDLIPYLLKLSHGDLKALSQRYALEVHSSSAGDSPGPSFSYKFTIALCSKSLPIVGERPLLLIPLSDILRYLYHTPIPF